MTNAEGNTHSWNGWEEQEARPFLFPIKQLRLLKTKREIQPRRLVVVLHGLQFPLDHKVNSDCYQEILKLLLCDNAISENNAASAAKAPPNGLADLLLVDYPNDICVKKAVAESISPAIGSAIEQIHEEYASITLLGHSFGSLLARRVLVDAAEQSKKWTQKTLGLVVLAGTNLGFKYQKTDDFWVRTLGFVAGISDKFFPWLTDTLVYWNVGRLLSYSWRNSPWVIDTRIKWLRHFEGSNTVLRSEGGDHSLHFGTLYICAEKDEFVGADDLQMVYQLGGFYYQHQVIGAYHSDFLDEPYTKHKAVATRLRETPTELKAIREAIQVLLMNDADKMAKDKHWKAIIRVSTLHGQNKVLGKQEQPIQVDEGINRTVVFLIHGIRDNAEWQEDIDYNLRALSIGSVIQVSQVRYGYFNALQFLFPSERKRAVRAFSDEYLRVLARFPDLKAENIHVYAHSNGTFVFGQALKQYKEIKVNRVLMGGSVLPTNFPWRRFVNCRHSSCENQVKQLLNYAANTDWPTGWLCRGLSYLRGVDGPLLGVGPGGTDGFRELYNFKFAGAEGLVNGWNFYLQGGHGATLEPGSDSPCRIAKYLLGYSPGSPEGRLPFSQEELDNGLDPFYSKTGKSSSKVSYWSVFRGLTGTLLSAGTLFLFLMLLISLLGFLSIDQIIKNLLMQTQVGVSILDFITCSRESITNVLPEFLKHGLGKLNLRVLMTMLLAYLLSRF